MLSLQSEQMCLVF